MMKILTPPPSFLQSPEWEAFERGLGRPTRRVQGAMIVRRDLPFGLHYLYCPRPASKIVNQESGTIFFTSVKKIAEQQKAVFLKIDPAEEIIIAGGAGGTIRPARAIQPRETALLDLADRTGDELLAAMHEKTRYNIRLAERKGVIAGDLQSGKSETFWDLLRETAERDGFRTHPKGYYEKLLTARSDDFSNELFFAEYGGEVLAAALVNFYHPASGAAQATYLHGASRDRHREVMAPHLLQWRIIQEARQRGCGAYDFWGIDEQRWSGVTRFKRGFAGREIAYPQSVDIVYRPIAYTAYEIAKKIRP